MSPDHVIGRWEQLSRHSLAWLAIRLPEYSLFSHAPIIASRCQRQNIAAATTWRLSRNHWYGEVFHAPVMSSLVPLCPRTPEYP